MCFHVHVPADPLCVLQHDLLSGEPDPLQLLGDLTQPSSQTAPISTAGSQGGEHQQAGETGQAGV
jgi:hypothetical protein